MRRTSARCGIAATIAIALAGGAAVEIRAQPDAAQLQLLEFVLEHLGFTAAHREAVLAGESVHTGMAALEHLEEEVAAAGAVMLVSAQAAPHVIETFLATEVFRQVHELVRLDPVELTEQRVSPDELFEDFSIEDEGSLRRIVRDPAEELNLSTDDARHFEALAAGADQTSAAVTAALRRVLAERLAEYAGAGLDGIPDYVRPNGERISPAAEIRSGLAGLDGLEPAFGEFVRTLGKAVEVQDERSGLRRLHWAEKIVDDKQVLVLMDQVVSHAGDRGIAAEIHFYASAGYNAMVTLVAALPHGEETLVFAINHAYTDRLTGIGSALRHRIGREMAATALANHLQRLRVAIESSP